MNIFTKFHEDRTQIVDFLLVTKLLTCALFFYVHPLYQGFSIDV